jgi:hypothetical protein
MEMVGKEGKQYIKKLYNMSFISKKKLKTPVKLQQKYV